MLSLEWIPRLISLDLMWFVELAMNNLVWVMVFVGITFIFNEMKFSPKIFVVLSLGLIGFEEFFAEMGIFYLVGGFLFVFYVFEFIVLVFAEAIPSLKGKLPFVETIYFLAILTIYFVFLGG
ncbi:MAG: hypothetical protein ABIJ74_00395 [archaeon]